MNSKLPEKAISSSPTKKNYTLPVLAKSEVLSQYFKVRQQSVFATLE